MDLLIKENYSSLNLWKKINLLSEDQIKIIAKGLRWTVENVQSAVLVGGTAVVHYLTNNRKLTPDLDFLVDDVSIVKEFLYDENKKYKPLNTGTGYNLGIVVNELNCDYLDVNVGNVKMNKLILETHNSVTIGGYKIRIINPELLTVMKLEIGRDRDLEDALSLLSSGVCDKNEYISYANHLKNTLQDYDSIINYQDLIK